MEFPSQYSWVDLGETERKEHYTNLLKEYKRAVRLLDAMCALSRSHPIYD